MGRYNQKNIHIDPSVYQHPADRTASDAVRKSEAFQKSLGLISRFGIEKEIHGLYRACCAQITPSVSPAIHEMLKEAQEMFDVPVIPDIFLERTYQMRVLLTGVERPVVTVSSELLRQMDEPMLWGLMASEMAAVKAGFGEIKLIEWLCSTAGPLLPAGIAASLKVLLKNWHRYAQYTYDRTTLIAGGDFNRAVRFMLLGEAPAGVLDKMDFLDPNNRYMKQCRSFLSEKDLVANTVRGAGAVLSGGDFYASRYMELFRFYHSDYQDLIEEFE